MTQVSIPFLSLGAAVGELRDEIDEAIRRVLDSGWYLLGPELEAFEKEWAAYVNAEHAVGVGNGLEAMHLALRACDIGPGDEVIVPSNTYIATWLAVSYVGATPVPVEPEENTCTLDPDRVAAAITPRTRAVMPVHLYGFPCNMEPILAVAKAHGLRVVEDAAQCHGARYKDQPIGAHGDLVAWSFYPSKNLGALSDAGAVTTNNPTLAERIRVLRNYGSRVRYYNEEIGFNSRLEEIQAAILRVKLRHLNEWNARRIRTAERYRHAFKDLPLTLMNPPEWAMPVWHLFTIRHPLRDPLQKLLLAAGINTIIHYPIPPHRQAAYSSLGMAEGTFPVSERIHREILSLPIGPHLSDDDQACVIDAVTRVISQLYPGNVLA